MGKSKSKAAQMRVPKKNRQLFEQLVELIDAFCDAHLNEDYKELCEEMAAELCVSGFSFDRGRLASWASGIVHAVGWVNFLHDHSRSPYMTPAQLAKGFGVSKGTMMAKSKIIRDKLDIFALDPNWCLPELLKDNPLVWMLEVNGFVMDARYAPREIQEEAYRLGLIPFIPADEEEPQLQSDTEAKVIKFPSGQKETTKQKSVRKPTDDEPSLFGGLEQ